MDDRVSPAPVPEQDGEPRAAPEVLESQLLERLWRTCETGGMDRRGFLRMMSASGAAGLLAACEGTETTGGVGDEGGQGTEDGSRFHFKDTSPFILHGSKNLETRLEDLGGWLTPNELFFVRNNSRSIEVEPEPYRLVVDGDGVDDRVELSYGELLAMPSRTVFSYLECGGNQRAFFDRVMDRTASGTQWTTGGIGMAVWTGVPMTEVLDRAGLRDDAVDVQMIGLDAESPEGGFRRPIPVRKAVDPDTLLAMRMNGEPLPRDHGFPVRAIVPGWVGSTNIKWLGRLEVSTEKIWSRNNTTSYVLIGDAYPPEGEAEGKVATLQSIKSALALPWPARLAAGRRRIRGYAQSPRAPIATVEWSDDDGVTWRPARVLDPRLPYSWARFEFEWDAEPGPHTLLTRATDEAGNIQPDQLPFNRKGYLFNLPLPHPVRVG